MCTRYWVYPFVIDKNITRYNLIISSLLACFRVFALHPANSVIVIVCDEAAMVEHIAAATASGQENKTPSSTAGQVAVANTCAKPKAEKTAVDGPRSSAGGLFDVILLGGGSAAAAAASVSAAAEDGEGGGLERARHSPGERLDLVLDR